MRGTVTGLVAALMLGLPAAADEAAVRGIIDGQMDAFRADDFATAFGFASPGIQGMFRDPATFGRMVRQGYPMVWRPAEVEYLGGAPAPDGWRQEVLVTDGAGRIHVLRYTMVETSEGWRIGGVQILDAPQVGA